MLKGYLDTNIYYISRTNSNTNSRKTVNAAIAEQFEVVQSDYLYGEIQTLFKRKFNKDVASYQIKFMNAFPLKTIIYEENWSTVITQYKSLITDIDDLPHICSYFVGKCDYFITANRHLTQMEIKNEVNFITPKKFIDKLGLKSVDTGNEI